ncbi:hypothetical protein [Marinomonas flavescens]|uniref:hypothetical protein n=1 Tax=Marinomonas flavescens TaxID=2529379 RepID=UPI0010560002|nr:hypothetical protein [Marinomonas flavescens]
MVGFIGAVVISLKADLQVTDQDQDQGRVGFIGAVVISRSFFKVHRPTNDRSSASAQPPPAPP